MKLGRSRSLRGNVSPLPGESPGREPFCLGPFRQQKSFPVPMPSFHRTPANGENVPPNNNHTAAYVKAQSPDNSSPALLKSSRKGRNSGAAILPGSPALLPRPPASKPSPAPIASKPELPVGDNMSTTKRKLSWDAGGQFTDNVPSTATVDSSDSGVNVIIRIRPLNPREEQEEEPQIVRRISTDTVAIPGQHFTYDEVAAEGSSQQDIFEMIGLPMVEHCLSGFNSSIFAYGQTGSGKTHTMMGVVTDPGSSLPPSDGRGLIPRAFERLFSRIQQEEKIHSGKGLIYQCRCSFLEIYNEQITDLLEPTRKNLLIREDVNKGVYVDTLSEEFVSNVDDVTRLLVKGLSNRRIGVTLMNNESSRSHSVFTCVIESRFKNFTEGGNSVRRSRMNLVDLAGSERQKQTGAAGERLKEAGNINKSLSQLGNVINILGEIAQSGKMRHIPYRDSRLTFLLQESLGGNAKLAMICAISPAHSCRSETLSTLRFAQRAKAIQNRAVVNEETVDDVGFLREQIRQLKDELKRIKSNGDQDACASGYSNGWNARRSYNLLRLSLNYPMTLPISELADTDLEMEIDDDSDKENDPVVVLPSAVARDASRDVLTRLPVINEKDSLLDEVSMDMSSSVDGICVGDLKPSCSPDEVVSKRSDPPPLLMPINDDDNRTKVEELVEIPDLMIPRILHSPPLSVSPRLNGTPRRSLSGSLMGPPPQAAATCDVQLRQSMCEEVYHSTQERFVEDSNSSQSPQSRNGSPSLPAVRSSSVAIRATEKLAASLHRGLQILEGGHRGSVASLQKSTAGLRFSNLRSDCQLPRIIDKCDKEVQTSTTVLVSTSTSPTAPTAVRLSLQEKISSCNLRLSIVDDSLPNSFSEVAISPARLQEHVMPCFHSPLVELSEVSPPLYSASKEFSSCLVEDKDETQVIPLVKLSENSPPSKPTTKQLSADLVEDRAETQRNPLEEFSENCPPLISATVEFSRGLVNDSDETQGTPLVELSENSPPLKTTTKQFSGGLVEDCDETKGTPLVELPENSPPLKSATKLFSGGLVGDCETQGTPLVGLFESPPPLKSAITALLRGLVEDGDETQETPTVELFENSPPLKSASKDFSSGLVEDRDETEGTPLVNLSDDSVNKEFLNCLVEDSTQLQLCLCAESPGDLPQELGDRRDLSPRNWIEGLQSGHLQLSPSPLLERTLASEPHQRCLDGSSLTTPRSSSSTSQWQLVPRNVPKEDVAFAGLGNSSQLQIVQAVEAVLAGAIRRERVAEEATRKQAAEIEQLNRLVRQYKHERECNAILHQTREDKIARLEFLVANAIPTDAYLNDEWSALLLENKILQGKFDNHPEVTQSSVDKQRLLDELHQYRNFFDLGEREILLEEVANLRNQLQNLLESSGTSPSARQRCAAHMSLQVANFNDAARSRSNSSLALVAIPGAHGTSGLSKSSADLSMVVSGQAEYKEQPDAVKDAAPAERIDFSHSWEAEKREIELDWEERERDWMGALEELREEVESYKHQADKSKQLLEGEKRCSEEMQEALQMAMTGHARLLEQYAELQEKHLNLLAKQRKIKDGCADVKRMAKKAGVTSVESRWLETQALQLAALRVEHEEEKNRSKEEIESLQSQLRDTAEAVQAAGELLVRLKEAEESVIIAQDAEAMAKQSSSTMRREMDKIRRRHTTEVAVLQQRLLESRLHKTAVCPMCVMAERVKFQFNAGAEDEDGAEEQTEASTMPLKVDPRWENYEAHNSAQQFEDHCNYESEILGDEEEFDDELHLNEFDELDHLFTGSTHV